MLNIDPKEVSRYLSYRGTDPDERVSAMITECIADVNSAAVPRSVVKRFPLEILEDGSFRAASVTLKSDSLRRNLTGCEEVFLFGATLGTGVDVLIRRASVMDIARGVVTQAAAAAAIEAYCDELNDELRRQVTAEGLYLRPRFSPGYGDLDLSCQQAIIHVLQAPKEIGLTLTDSGLMVPVKSVTALIGISSVPTDCIREGCEGCSKECEFRRNSHSQ